MNTQIRTWGIALSAVIAFAVPRLVTQADGGAATPATVPAVNVPAVQAAPAVQKTLNLKITAYTSDVAETDDSPFITADGSYVHDGVVATNLLPFGTKVKIPSLFGDKIFTVDDRMSKKLMNNLDIWMGNRTTALIFGAHTAKVVVLQNSATVVADAAAIATKAMTMAAVGSKLRGPSVRQL